MLEGTISEKEIHDAVAALRASVQDKYDWATRYNRHDWLTPVKGYDSMMTKVQIYMGQVFPSSKRILRLKVTEILLGIEGLEITSFKDLFPSEISPLIGAFDDIPKFRLVLNAIGMDQAGWATRLGVTLKRPAVVIPADAPPEVEEDDDWTETEWKQPALSEDAW